MSETAVTWMTREGYERTRDELDKLLASRAAALSSRSDYRDEVDYDERQWQEMRIRQLQEILRTAKVGERPPDDGVAEPGMLVTVRYADDPETETFLLAARQDVVAGDVEVCSPDSPLGLALLGAREGEARQYELPRGGTMEVVLVKAEPFPE